MCLAETCSLMPCELAETCSSDSAHLEQWSPDWTSSSQHVAAFCCALWIQIHAQYIAVITLRI